MTIEDIAKLANVSKSTVSRVMNNKKQGVSEQTRQRVKMVMERYQFKPDISRGKIRIIGVVVPDITNSFFSALVKSIECYANDQGYAAIFCNTDSTLEKEEQALTTFFLLHVDGVILSSMVDEAIDVHRRLIQYNLPYVLLDREVRNIGSGVSVLVDNEYAIFRVTEYLIQKGSKQILFISGPPTVSTSIERIDGHIMALKHYHVPFRRELLKYGDYTYQSGVKIVRQALQGQIRFDAIIASNDEMALGAMSVLKEDGLRIPEDVQVFGFDNTRSGQVFDPPLSTVEQPVVEMGRKAAEYLLKQISGGEMDNPWIRLDSHIILRGSTK